MSAEAILGNHWLEPLVPTFPSEILQLAEQVPFQAGKLSAIVAPQMVRRVGGLLRVTSSFYSNLIEGQFTEPVTLAPTAPRRNTNALTGQTKTPCGTRTERKRYPAQ